MTRAAVAAVVSLAALAGHARADNALNTDDDPLSIAQRVERHLAAAGAADDRGDRETAAAELVIACSNILYTGDPRTMAICGNAQRAAAPYPYLAGRLASAWSCAVAWTLDWVKARQLAETALALGGPPPETLAGEGLRGAHLCLGAIAIEEGKYDEATRELDLFVAQSEAAGDHGFLAAGLTWQCRLATALGDGHRARQLCDRAETLAAGDVIRMAGVSWQRAQLESGPGTSAPIALWERALADAIAAGSPMWVSSARLMLADRYLELGRLDDADRLLDEHDAEIAARRVPDSYASQVAAVRGTLFAARGDHAGALAFYDVGVTSPQYGQALASLGLRAYSLAAIGRYDEARASLEQAIARIEAARTRTPEDTRRTYLDRHAEVYRGMALIEQIVGGPDAATRAFAAAEAGRARALLDAIHAASAPFGGPDPARTPDAVLSAASTAKRTPAEIQAALAPDQTLVVYVTYSERALAIRVTREAITAVHLPGAGDVAALAARVRYFRDLVAETDDAAALDAAGAALYRDLLAPLFPHPPSGTLIIAPDGPLHALPFDALIADGRFLAEHADVVLTPSGSLLGDAPRAADASPPVFAVGAPVMPADLPPLLAADDELRALARPLRTAPVTLAGAGATEAKVREALGRFRVLHFATHAIVDEAVPGRSGLVLTADGADDGRLRVDEVYGARLGGELVVLSACRTGDGVVSSTEGPLSLARAFLYAGAGAVIATLWDVDDGAGPPFMGELYRRFGDGAPVSVAVAATKRAMIARRAAPRAWAGYVAIGRPAATPDLPAAASPRRWRHVIALALALGGLVSIAGGWMVRRRTHRAR